MSEQTSYQTCEYGHHSMDRFGNGCWYSDASNGIPKMIHICDACYKKHILKYYPDSKIADYLRKQEAV